MTPKLSTPFMKSFFASVTRFALLNFAGLALILFLYTALEIPPSKDFSFGKAMIRAVALVVFAFGYSEIYRRAFKSKP